MIFKELELKGAWLIKIEGHKDERGFFARTFCKEEFRQHGIGFNIAQCNLSYNKKKGTLRGMHFQNPPYEEAKIITCMKGAIYDVIIDLRRKSTTYGSFSAIKLKDDDYCMLYVPEGFAHGFQTLEDNTLVYYQMSEFYHVESAKGIRWNDPLFKIPWPLATKIVSKKDLSYPDFKK
jgi:dTDP-4-dehydrorhamnose 3,5-epimerase